MPDGFRRAHGPYETDSGGWKVVLVRDDGTRVTRTLARRAEADKLLEDLKLEASGARSIRDTVTGYLEACRTRGLAPSSVERIGYHLTSILGLPRNGDRALTWLRGRGTELYAAERGKPNRADDTHRHALSAAKTFGKWCRKRKLLRECPFEDVEPEGRARAGRDKPQLRVDESRKLADHCLALCSPGVQAHAVAVLGALLLGPRAREMVERDVRDLDDHGRLLWIPDSKTDSGRRTLEVPEVLQPLLRALASGKRPSEPLFVADDLPTARRKLGPRRATRHWLYYHCRELCEAAGVPVVGSHGMRRSHGSIARRAGATGELVAAQLGHGSVAVQERSYVERGAAEAGQVERVLRVIQGGRR